MAATLIRAPRLLAPITQQLLALACAGYGTVGAYQAAGLALAIPAGFFVRALHNAPLDDPDYDADAFDRRVRVAWRSSGDEWDPDNPYNGTGRRIGVAELHVGYLCGPGHGGRMNVRPGEDAADAGTNWDERGLSDAEELRQVVGWPEFWGGTDPRIVSIKRQGVSSFRTVAPDRVLCITPLAITYERNAGVRYAPP